MGLIAEIRGRGEVADYLGLVERIPYARLLGLSIDSIDAHGQVVTRLRFDLRVVGNPNLPTIHGGVIGAFLEMAAIFQLVREGEGDRLPKPINLTVEYLLLGRAARLVRARDDHEARPTGRQRARASLARRSRPPSRRRARAFFDAAGVRFRPQARALGNRRLVSSPA